MLGHLDLSRGDPASAVRDLGRARDLLPLNLEVRLALSDAYRRRNQRDSAIAELEGALRIAPSRDEVRTALVRQYIAQHSWPLAEQLLEEAQAAPEQAGNPAWLQLESQMWLARDDPKRALDSMREAATKQPENEILRLQLLTLLNRQKQYEEVVRVTDEIVSKSQPGIPWYIYVQRGTALHGVGKDQDAERAFELAASAADSAAENTGDDTPTELIADSMVKAMGKDKTLTALAARKDARWRIQVALTHAVLKEWDQAAQEVARLTGAEFAKLSSNQQLRTLQIAGQVYSLMAQDRPDAVEKARDVSWPVLRLGQGPQPVRDQPHNAAEQSGVADCRERGQSRSSRGAEIQSAGV